MDLETPVIMFVGLELETAQQRSEPVEVTVGREVDDLEFARTALEGGLGGPRAEQRQVAVWKETRDRYRLILRMGKPGALRSQHEKCIGLWRGTLSPGLVPDGGNTAQDVP